MRISLKKGEGVPGTCLQHGDDAIGIVGVGISVRRAAPLRRVPPHPPHRVGRAQDVWRGRSTWTSPASIHGDRLCAGHGHSHGGGLEKVVVDEEVASPQIKIPRL